MLLTRRSFCDYNFVKFHSETAVHNMKVDPMPSIYCICPTDGEFQNSMEANEEQSQLLTLTTRSHETND